jgi:large subunit ribosomal protein L5
MPTNRLRSYHDKVTRYDSMIQLPLNNAAVTPEISHIVLNKGLGNKDRKHLLSTFFALEIISGQRPYITEAKKSIDKFKLRQGMPIGCKATLRASAAYLFLDRFILRILPKATPHSVKKQKPRSSTAIGFGLRDLNAYGELLLASDVNDQLGGLDIVFVYSRGCGVSPHVEKFIFGHRRANIPFGRTNLFNEIL